jgi:putative ABC transport system permease protein
MTTPPKILLWLLDRSCPPSRQDLKGDFLELYEYRREEKGKSVASWRFFWDIVTVLPLRFFTKSHFRPQSSIPMFSHYVKAAARQMTRNRAFSSINVLGLALGMSTCFLITQYVYFENSYDRFHKKYRNIYRVVEKSGYLEGDIFSAAATTFALGPAGAANIPEIQNVVRLHPQYDVRAVITNMENNNAYNEDGLLFSDSTFFEMFDFSLKRGDKKSALSERNSIVITDEMAKKYFGNENPLEKLLKIDCYWTQSTYKVTGVLEALPTNSHLQFDLLLPIENLLDKGVYTNNDGWSTYNFTTYVTLHDGSEANEISNKYLNVPNSIFGEGVDIDDFRIEFQPIADIHLKSHYDWDALTDYGNAQNLRYFTLVAILIIFIAWINYVNLSTAQAMSRSKEVGVRKSLGAQQRQLIGQFITEALLTNSIALLVAVAISRMALPVLNSILGYSPSFSLLRLPEFWVASLGVVSIGILVCGLYPALLLSSFKPANMMRRAINGSSTYFGWRKVLLSVQFLISLLILSATYLVFDQISFMKKSDLGVDMEQLLIVKGPVVESANLDRESVASSFKTEVSRDHTILSVAGSKNVPGKGDGFTTGVRKAGQQEETSLSSHLIDVDLDFNDTYGYELIAGRWFSSDFATDNKRVVINKYSLYAYDFSSPEEALNQTLLLGNGDSVKVIGVLKDFHWHSLKQAYEPYLFTLSRFSSGYFSIKVDLNNLEETIAHIEKNYAAAFPGNPFEYFFLDDSFNRQYQADLQFGNLFTAFSMLAIFISCLGLLALVSFSASLKTKEIGIRKVLGASVGQLMTLLSKEYLVLLFSATVLAIPLVIWCGQQWLENYAFRIEMGVEFIVVPAIVLLLVSLLTVSRSTWKAARANPVESLKAE